MDIAVAVTVFQRTGRLSNLIDSIDPSQISKLHIADDGTTADRDQLYNQEYGFEVEVHDLPYDSGVGTTRAKLAEEVESEYVLCVDCDHEIPPNVDILHSQLEADSSLGGVAGNVIEPEVGRIWQSGKDFHEVGDTLYREVSGDAVDIEFLAGHPLVRFDFIPQAMLLRRECLDEYSWDEQYQNSREHIDFFVGHWRTTGWEFGICPSVVFPHYPGGPDSYVSEREDTEKRHTSFEYFLDKWGYNDVRSTRPYWINSSCQHAPHSYIRTLYNKYTAERTRHWIRKGVQRVLRETNTS